LQILNKFIINFYLNLCDLKKNKNIVKHENTIENLDFRLIGETLRELRILSNISFADLARGANKVNGTVFSQIESGHTRNPTYEALNTYAQLLGVPLSFIFLIHESKSESEKSELWQIAKNKVLERCNNTEDGGCRLKENCICRNVVQ
jgi:transcriptional regulator with XRE-family HTH domain